MDKLDQGLIARLRTNARTPVAKLAKDLGVSRATITNRLDGLIRRGVIQGFTILLKSGAGSGMVRSITTIEVSGESPETVLRQLHGFPEVCKLSTTNGRWDIVAEIESDTLEMFDDTLRRIRELDGISATETSILLSERKGSARTG